MSVIRLALISGGMLASMAAGMALQHASVLAQEWKPSAVAQAVAADRAAPASSAQPASTWAVWQMDTRLSLNLIKRVAKTDVEAAEPPMRLSLSPNLDMSDEAVPAGAGALMIDPPAAGRVQTPATQAVEAYRRAIDLLDHGRDAQAMDALQQALKLDPSHTQARRLAVTLAFDFKQPELAANLIDDGLKADPRDQDLQFLQARRLMSVGAADQALKVLQNLERPTGEALGLKAGLLARGGQYAPAAQAYEQALRTRPDNATWWLGLGVAWQAQGQGAQAKDAFFKAYRLGQLSPDVQAWLEQQL